MSLRSKIEAESDSIIEILAAQCADLEALLAQARRQALAVEQEDFAEMLRIVAERAALGERLEVYHRQLAEMRARMGEAFENVLENGAATRSARLIAEIQASDARALPLLVAARDAAVHRSAQLTCLQRTASAYAGGMRRGPAVACDRLA